MSAQYERLMAALDAVKKTIGDFTPTTGLVLGSGLGDYASGIEAEYTVNYGDIKGFPVSTVQGHRGRFVFGRINGAPVVIMQGRVHYYEGYAMEDAVMPIRLMRLMGAENLLLTNAAGGINRDFKPGDFMLITDHINLAPNPLIGENIGELGERFPDMSGVYDKGLNGLIRGAAEKAGILLKEGVYIQLTGPSYETAAEIRAARILGADAVGMSTACEAVAANHAGMKVAGISCISNLACGITDKPLTHAEVQETADAAAPVFKKLITEAVAGFK